MEKTDWTPLQAEIIRLDKLLVKTMYPECEIDDVNIAPAWLKVDVVSILMDANDIDKKADEILTFIKEHSPTYADAIISEFLDMEERKKCARIHNDFATALANMTPREIAVALEFGFFDSDLYALAKLHQNGQFREKIEDLLTDCNFHQECNAFMNGDYDSISRYT